MTAPSALMLAAYVRAPVPLLALRSAVARAMGMTDAELGDLYDEGAQSCPCFVDLQPLDGAFVWAVNLTVHQLPPSAPATDLVLAKRLASLLGADVLADHSGQYGEWALVCADGRAFIVQEQLGEEKEGFWIHEDPATWRPLFG